MKLTDIFVPQDRLYPSDNEYEIPALLLDRQPENGLLLPFAPWGANARRRKHLGTVHFYVDDYRFQNIWLHPEKLFQTGCRELNKLGVPAGYNAFATRGVSECSEILIDELEVAKEISCCDNPNLIVYGGGEKVKEICRKHSFIYVEQYMVRMREAGREVENG